MGNGQLSLDGASPLKNVRERCAIDRGGDSDTILPCEALRDLLVREGNAAGARGPVLHITDGIEHLNTGERREALVFERRRWVDILSFCPLCGVRLDTKYRGAKGSPE
jgi:hypothetical protein